MPWLRSHCLLSPVIIAVYSLVTTVSTICVRLCDVWCRASHTTRCRYVDEVAGKDYHFISLDEFERGIRLVCSCVLWVFDTARIVEHPSVCLCVRLSHHSTAAVAGLLLSATQIEDIDRQRQPPGVQQHQRWLQYGAAVWCSSANASSVMLTANVGSWTQTATNETVTLHQFTCLSADDCENKIITFLSVNIMTLAV